MAKIFIPLREDLIPIELKNKMEFENDSFYIIDSPENRILFQDFIPYGFKKNIKPLKIDLIPKTSWGASLSNALTSETWDAIRKPFIAHYGNRCQLCGQRGKGLKKTIKDVDTHEIWEYTELCENEKRQTLKGFLALCSGCHLMFHLGFARMNDKGDITIKRLQKLEKLNNKEIIKRIDDIDKTWAKRSNYEWIIDISILKDFGINNLKFKQSKNIDPSKFIF